VGAPEEIDGGRVQHAREREVFVRNVANVAVVVRVCFDLSTGLGADHSDPAVEDVFNRNV